MCASYNGQPPDNAAQFCKWLEGDQGADALSGVRYAVFGCGNRDWAATYQTVPRFIDDQLSKFGARRISGRGEGDAREDLDGEFQRWFAALRPLAAQEFNIDVDLVREPPTAPLYQVEIVPKPPVNPIIGSLGAQPLQVFANRELQQRTGPDGSDRSTRHIEVKLPVGMTYRAGDHLSIVPSNSAALIERVTRRFGLRDDDHVRLDAAEGRRASLPAGQPMSIQRLLGDYVELQTVATRKHIQSMAEHSRCPVTKPSLDGLRRGKRGSVCALQGGGVRKAKIGSRFARGVPSLRAAVQCLPRNAAADGAALLFDLIVTSTRCRPLQHHSGSRRDACPLGQRHLPGRLLEPPLAPGDGQYCSRSRARDKGRFQAAAGPGNADHHDRPRDGPRAVPRISAGASGAEGQGTSIGSRRSCSSVAATPITISSMPTS